MDSESAKNFCIRSNLSALVKQSLAFTYLPPVLELRHLDRTDQKRSDGLTVAPWAVRRQLLWDVTVVRSLAPRRISTCSNYNPRTAWRRIEIITLILLSKRLLTSHSEKFLSRRNLLKLHAIL